MPLVDGLSPLRLDAPHAELLRREVPRISASIVAAITDSVPEYGELDGAAREAVRRTAETAIGSFIDRAESGAVTDGIVAGAWSPGTGAWRSGRSLEALLAAFRIATRVAWEAIAETAVKADVGAETVSRLAGALFAGAEQAAARASESYARAQADAAGEREAHRARIAALLIRDPPAGEGALRRAADLGGWRMPEAVAVIALGDGHDPRRVAGRIGPDVLSSDPGQCVIVPDADAPARTAVITRACAGGAAAVGPAVAPGDTLRSLAWARETLALVLSGELPATPPPRASENLLSLVFARGSDLIDALARKYGLEAGAAAGSRIDLERTVLIWLAHDRSATAAAEILHLHPQTVRYRIARARELVGPALDDPVGAFELRAVLYARRQLRSG